MTPVYEPIDRDVQMTHWAGCEISHHGCALARLAEARAEIELLRETSRQLDEAMIGGSDVEIAKAIAAWRLAIEGESTGETA